MTMISRGRAIGGPNIANRIHRYLLHNPKNEKAIFLGSRGTAFPDDPLKSLQQMALMGELMKSDKTLYHGIISPDLNVDKISTREQWERFIEIQAEELGFDTWIVVGHHARGRDGNLRIHAHIIYQTYDPQTGNMIPVEFDRLKHAKARERIELEFGHDRTFQRWTLEEKRQQELEQFQLNAEEAAKLKQRQEQEDKLARMQRMFEMQQQQEQGNHQKI